MIYHTSSALRLAACTFGTWSFELHISNYSLIAFDAEASTRDKPLA